RDPRRHDPPRQRRDRLRPPQKPPGPHLDARPRGRGGERPPSPLLPGAGPAQPRRDPPQPAAEVGRQGGTAIAVYEGRRAGTLPAGGSETRAEIGEREMKRQIFTLLMVLALAMGTAL